jgi:multidrug efflux system outer membrane protein
MRKVIQYIVSLTAVLLLLSSCGVYGKYTRPESLETEGLYRTTDLASAPDTTALPMAQLRWDELFTDPYLQQLIDTALVRNADLRTAELTLEKARAGLMQAGLSFAPDLSFAPSASQSYVQDRGWSDENSYTLPLASSWQIDLNGQLLAGYRSAAAGRDLAEAGLQMAHAGVVASVANVYYTLGMLRTQLRSAETAVSLAERTVTTLEALHRTGMVTKAAVAQATARAAEVRSTYADLQRQYSETENSLALLLHMPPQSFGEVTLTDLQMPEDYSTGVPMDLLATRPDLLMAEAQLRSAFYATEAARGAFLPSLKLSANGSWVNMLGEVVVDPMKFVGNAVATLVQPLFTKGRNTAQLRIARANQESALIDYQQQVYAAGVEVSEALVALSTQEKILAERATQVEQLTEAVRATEMLMELQNVNYLEVLTAQQNLLSAELALAADRVKRNQAVISLYMAVGGGTF